jgi:hypothetical protein
LSTVQPNKRKNVIGSIAVALVLVVAGLRRCILDYCNTLCTRHFALSFYPGWKTSQPVTSAIPNKCNEVKIITIIKL